MKRMIVLMSFVAILQSAFGYDWLLIAKDIYEGQQNRKIFGDSECEQELDADLFYQMRKRVNILKLAKVQEGDTLYIDDFLSNRFAFHTFVMTKRKKYTYDITFDVVKFKMEQIRISKKLFKPTAIFQVLYRWDEKEMQRLRDLYPKHIFEGGVHHYSRIILLEKGRYKIDMFVARGLCIDKE